MDPNPVYAPEHTWFSQFQHRPMLSNKRQRYAIRTKATYSTRHSTYLPSSLDYSPSSFGGHL
jgi:hypothetical protein